MPASNVALRRAACTAAWIVAPLWAAPPSPAAEPMWQVVENAEIDHGQLRVLFRDNSRSPQVLSGAAALLHREAAPRFDAFDPDSPGASAGLNFEHVISGHRSANNKFTPRHGPYRLERNGGAPQVRLVRDAADSPWNLSSTLTYTLVAPAYVDVDFRCQAHDASHFGPRGYAVLFFANYMNDMEQVALHFLGTTDDSSQQRWIAADAPPGHADYNGGGTYRHVAAPTLQYDDDHDFTLNLWSYDSPRFTLPFYYGRAANGMVLIMMFDRAHTARDEIRFSLFKFKLHEFPRPALDWQYVIHRVDEARQYGFRARLVWKKFVSAEDCLHEYERWASALPPDRPCG